MPEIINCPKCERKLRVPDNLLGQPVKCPSCGITFTGGPADEAPPEAAPRPMTPPAMPLPPLSEPQAAPEPPRPTWDSQPPGPQREPEFARSRPLRDRYDDYDDSHSTGALTHAEASQALQGPALALVIICILSIICHVGYMGLGFIGAAGGLDGPRRVNNAAMNPEAVGMCSNFIFGAVGLVLDILVLLGAQKMRDLESYGFAMTACILSLIPCFGPCCGLTLPFGIWGLVALNQPGVRERFHR